MASGQGSHWFVDSPAIICLCLIRPFEIFVNFVLKHIHASSIHTTARGENTHKYHFMH